MTRSHWIIAIISVLYFCETSAQEKKWTLEDCINYAVSNNLGLKRQILQTETAEANLLKSKMDVLPSLNLGSDARIGFGRSVDPVTNLITFKQNISNSYSLNTNFQLFSGFTALNSISAYKFMFKAGLESEKINRNILIVDILGQYYHVLYARGLESASKLQLELSEKQHYRIVKLVETGKEALSKQFEIESQVSADKLDYTIAYNSASQALTTMKQMLQLDPGTYFDLAIPEMNSLLISDQSYDPDSIFSIASNVLPRLKAIEYELRASEKQISAAKGAIAPSLSVGGAVYTGYYKVLSGDTEEQVSFSTQLKNNNSQAIYMSLNVPIFNNYTTGRNIRIAKIRKNDAALRLEQEKNSLYTEIENACLDYNRGRDEFIAAQSNFEYNKKSFSAVEKKFETGLVDVTDYSAAKTTLFRAETEALRTQLQLIIRKLTINFYTTGEYENSVFNK
ncbi:MAG: TolC family protein [Bacteroidia bacterium]|nr:TolC family protein [Bacteroidia bacterium]